MASNIFTLLQNKKRTPITMGDVEGLVGRPNLIQFPPGLGGESAPGRGASQSRSTPAYSIPFTIFAPYKRNRQNLAFYSSTGASQRDVLDDQLPSPSFAIALPTPTSALKTTYGVEYQTIDVGQAWGSIGIGEQLQKVQRSAQNISAMVDSATFDLVKDTAKEGASIVSDVFKNGAPIARWAIAQNLLEIAKSNAQVLNLYAGVGDNPYTENVFKNVTFRDHVFSYVFMPKNEKESQDIDRIIQTFKYAMLPKKAVSRGSGITEFVTETSAGAFFEFPYEFQITHSVQDTTFTLLPSVLSSLDVDYSGGTDSPKFFVPTEKGSQYPVRITLSMTFKEMILLTRDRVDKPEKVFDEDINDSNAVWRFRF